MCKATKGMHGSETAGLDRGEIRRSRDTTLSQDGGSKGRWEFLWAVKRKSSRQVLWKILAFRKDFPTNATAARQATRQLGERPATRPATSPAKRDTEPASPSLLLASNSDAIHAGSTQLV